MTKRSWPLALTLATIVAPACGRATATAQEPQWYKETFVYKTVGQTKIEVDVRRHYGAQERPAVVWIHGGALIMGSRESVPQNITELCRERNFVLISIDYRLAPEVKLPAIIEDLTDAFRWIHAEGVEKLRIDANRILVCGGSAGGYLTMMSGICIEPRPKALVAYWGYGDVDGAWYTQPSEHYRKQPLVSKLNAYLSVGGPAITGSDSRQRNRYYLYLRQNGLWTKEVTGFDPAKNRDKLDRYCPVRNITPDYPPILMVHGTADTDVPYQESVDMAAALEKQGVEHELITVEGGGHGLGGGDPKAIEEAHAKALAFIRKQLD